MVGTREELSEEIEQTSCMHAHREVRQVYTKTISSGLTLDSQTCWTLATKIVRVMRRLYSRLRFIYRLTAMVTIVHHV